MNKKWLWLVSAFGAVSYFEYTRYMKILDSISMKPSNTKISKEGSYIRIDFNLDITNATDKSLELDSVVSSLYNKDLLIGVFKMKKKTNVRANSTTSVNVSGLTTPVMLLDALSRGKVLNSTYTLKSKSNIRFNVLGILSIPVPISDVSTFNATTLLNQTNNVYNQFKALFKK
jgi:hypothetical protein